MKARDIMTTKVVTVSEDTSVHDIANLMIEKNISGVPVVDKRHRVVGMVSEGDLIRRAEIDTDRPRSRWLYLLTGPRERARDFTKTHGLHASDVMVKPVIHVHEGASLATIADLMERKRIKRLPVLAGERLVGLVTRADLLRALAAHKPVEMPPLADNDAAIRDRMNKILAEEEWAESAMVNVIVTDGNVQLWGVIDSEEQRQALHVAAEEIPGVKSVEDHMTFSLPT